jgi:hypothetical protein
MKEEASGENAARGSTRHLRRKVAVSRGSKIVFQRELPGEDQSPMVPPRLLLQEEWNTIPRRTVPNCAHADWIDG